ncbi:MAG TPA: rhodanese-like domain-containing protein [bacterium]
MNRTLLACLTATMILQMPGVSAATTEEGEKKVFEELSALIPKDRMVSVDDLYKKWLEVQEKKSKAIIIDIRTHDEFDNGHLLGSNNVDSGHAYTVPKTWPDAETEIWVLCRTKHRATYFGSFLYRYGYKNVFVVDGGIAAWAEKGYPLVSEYLGEIKVIKYNKQLKEEYQVRQGH